jgi:hypothetical protein
VSEPQDILQQGGDDPGPGRFRLPGRRPSRLAAAAVAAALVIGVAVGYAAGRQEPRAGAPPAPSASAAPSAGPGASFSFNSGVTVLAQQYGQCSAQSGHQLELGVQLTNQSAATVTLTAAHAVLPASGLQQVAQHWTTCGALPGTFTPNAVILQPGASTWLTVTLAVSVSCPAAYPVQFSVGYLTTGRSRTASLPGFPDLGSVPYNGCPAS